VISRDGRTIFAIPWGQRQLVSYDVVAGVVKKLHGFSFSRREQNKGFYPSRLAVDEARDLVIWSHSATVNVWHLGDGAAVAEFPVFDVYAVAMQLNPRTGEIVVGGTGVVEGWLDVDGRMVSHRDDTRTLVRGFDPVTGKQLHAYAGPGYSVEGLSVSNDGRFVAASKSRAIGLTPAYLHLWDAGSGAFSPDGKFLAVAVENAILILKRPS